MAVGLLVSLLGRHADFGAVELEVLLAGPAVLTAILTRRSKSRLPPGLDIRPSREPRKTIGSLTQATPFVLTAPDPAFDGV